MTPEIGLRSHAQNGYHYHLIARIALIVLDRFHRFPDDPVAVATNMDGIATFPLAVQGVSKIW